MTSSTDADYEDAARVFPIARHVRDHVGYILDAESRQIARASPEYAVQIVHALNALRAAPPTTKPETAGSWEERCAALYQVIGALANAAGVFETSDSVNDALDVACGRGDVENLLPWPKAGDSVTALFVRNDSAKLPDAAKVSTGALARWILKNLDWSGGNSDRNEAFLAEMLLEHRRQIAGDGGTTKNER